MNPANAVYSKNPDIVFRKIAHDYILVPIGNKNKGPSCIYTLNETAARIWGLIDGKTDSREIIKRVAEEFNADPQEIEKDTLGFLETLNEIAAINYPAA